MGKAHLLIVKTLLKRRAEGVSALPNNGIYCKARIIRTVLMQEQQVEQWTKGGQKQNLGNKGDWDITPQWEISELFSAQLGQLPHFKEKNQVQSHNIGIIKTLKIKVLTLKSNIITPGEGNIEEYYWKFWSRNIFSKKGVIVCNRSFTLSGFLFTHFHVSHQMLSTSLRQFDLHCLIRSFVAVHRFSGCDSWA